jgi:mono/diheme cytochrome c family protein
MLFHILVTFGLIVAGVVAVFGFAIDKADEKDDRPALAASTNAAIELIEDPNNQINVTNLDPNDPLRELILEHSSVSESPVPEENTVEIPQQDSDSPPDIQRGQELFFTNGCNVCHGDTGDGGIGPKISDTQLSISEVIAQYRNPRELMPQFDENRIPDHDVNNIYAWLKTLR